MNEHYYYGELSNFQVHNLVWLESACDTEFHIANYVTSGSITVTGTSETSFAVVCMPTQGIIFSGTVQVDFATAFTMSGGAIIGVAAATTFDWATHYSTVGSIILGFGTTSVSTWGTSFIGRAFFRIPMLYAGFPRPLPPVTTCEWRTDYETSGTINILGTMPPHYIATYEFTGGVIIGVSAVTTFDWATGYITTGAIIVGFDAVALAIWGTSYVAISSMVVGGASIIDYGTTYIGSSGITIGGEGLVTWGTSYDVSVVLVLSGEGDLGMGTTHTAVGSVIIGVAAYVRVDWITSWTAFGSIIVGIQAAAESAWGVQVEPIGVLILQGYSELRWATDYLPILVLVVTGESSAFSASTSLVSGGFQLDSTSLISWSTYYLGSGTAHIAGASYLYGGAANYLPLGGIQVQGTSSSSEALSIVSSGKITISGMSVARWGTSYIPTITVIVGSGTGRARTSYAVFARGGVIMGFAARAPVRWSVSVVPTGKIQIAGQCITRFGLAYQPTTGIRISGTVENALYLHYIWLGGIIVGFAAITRSVLYVSFVGSGTIYLEGSASSRCALSTAMRGGIIVFGSGVADWGTSYLCGVIIGVAGIAHVANLQQYDCVGGGVIAGTSPVHWGSHYTWVGGTIIGVAADSMCGIYEVRITPEGGILIGGRAWCFVVGSFVSTARIRILGSTDHGITYVQLLGVCHLFISGQVITKWRTSFVSRDGRIRVGSESTPGLPPHIIDVHWIFVSNGFIIRVGLYANSDHGVTKVELDCYGGIIISGPNYRYAFPYLPYTVVHRPPDWKGICCDFRVDGSLTPSYAMWWKFRVRDDAYVEWEAKRGKYYKVSLKHSNLNWEGNIPTKVYIDTWNEAYLENELLTYEEAKALVDATLSQPVSTAIEFNYNFADANRATAAVFHQTVQVRFLIRTGINVNKVAQHYAHHATLKSAGLNEGIVKGLRLIRNESAAGWADMTYAFAQVLTNPPTKLPDRGLPRNWSQ